MKKLLLSLTVISALFLFSSCESLIQDETDKDKTTPGKLTFEFQKPESITNVTYLAWYLTRPNFDTLSDTLDVSNGAPQTIEIGNIPSGIWTFKLDGLDSQYLRTYSGSVQITVYGGEVTAAEVTMIPVSGGISIKVNWGFNSGKAIFLDGDGDYVSVANTEKLMTLGGEFTVEAWVLPISQTYNTIFGKGFNTFMIEMTPGDFVGYYTKGITIDFSQSWVYYDRLMQPQALSTLHWNHIAYTFSASAGNVKLYYNGELVHTAPASGAMTQDTEPIRIGSRPYPNDEYKLFFKGSIDEVRIWSVARSESQILGNYKKGLSGNESGLVAYYNFDKLVDGKFEDLSGNGNPGILVGNTHLVPSGAF